MHDDFLQFLGIAKKARKLLEGYNKCEDALIKGSVYLLILAGDCSENTKEKFKRICESKEIPIYIEYSKEQLGEILGRQEIGVVGVTDRGIGEKLVKLWNGKNNM